MVDSSSPFSIVLDDSSKVRYAAGDRVIGKVRLSSTRDLWVGRVTIRFWGRSKTKLVRRDGNGNRRVYRGRSIFFWKELTLFNGRHKHKAPTLEWHFEFEFPYVAQNILHSDTWDDDDPRFLNSTQCAELDLPSSMFVDSFGFKSKFDCRVEYKLEASMTKPESSTSTLETERSLVFAQTARPNNISNPNPPSTVLETKQNFNIQSYKIDPQNRDRELSFKEKAKSTLNFSCVPSANFDITLEAPQVARLGERQSIILRLKHNTRSSGATFVPEVILKTSRIEIRAKTIVRSAREILRMPDSSHEDEFVLVRPNTDDSKPWSGSFRKEEDYTKTFLLQDLPSLFHVVPSFRTCNIQRSYMLKIDIRFECGGKEFKLSRDAAIHILPPYRQEDQLPTFAVGDSVSVPDNLRRSSSVSSVADSMLEIPEEPLPAYEGDPDMHLSAEQTENTRMTVKSGIGESNLS